MRYHGRQGLPASSGSGWSSWSPDGSGDRPASCWWLRSSSVCLLALVRWRDQPRRRAMEAEARRLGCDSRPRIGSGSSIEPFQLFRSTRPFYGEVENVSRARGMTSRCARSITRTPCRTTNGDSCRACRSRSRRLADARDPARDRVHEGRRPRRARHRVRGRDLQPSVRGPMSRPRVRVCPRGPPHDGVAALARRRWSFEIEGRWISGIAIRCSRGRSRACSRRSSPSSAGSRAR